MVEQNKTFTPEEIDGVRREVRMVMQDANLSQRAAAEAADIKPSTFAAWLNGSYSGDNDKVTVAAEIWLASRVEQAKVARTVPNSPRFQMTPTAKVFLDNFAFAQMMPDVSVIATGAGMGKSTAARKYISEHPHAYLATMSPTKRTVAGMLNQLCQVMGVDERATLKISDAVGKVVKDRGALIIADEAQNLSIEALEELRSLHDNHNVGLVLMGNQSVYGRLDGKARDVGFAQLFSRIGMRTIQADPTGTDVCQMVAAWQVEDAGAVKLMKAIASKPGAFRVLDKTMKLAHMLAAGAEEPLSQSHVKAAYGRLSQIASDR